MVTALDPGFGGLFASQRASTGSNYLGSVGSGVHVRSHDSLFAAVSMSTGMVPSGQLATNPSSSI